MTPEQEYERQWRLVDQSISMQSRLRDIYRRRSLALNAVTMLLAVLVGGFSFAGDLHGRSTLLGVEADDSTWIGVGACAILFLTILDLLLDWRGQVHVRRETVVRLALLKAAYRAIDTSEEGFAEEAARLTVQYDSIMSMVPSIPEHMFNRMKSWHRRKIEISKAIDRHPGEPLIITRIRVMWPKEPNSDA